MLRARSLFAALAVGASFLIAGCVDLPTAPDVDPDPSFGLLGSLGSTLGVGGGEVTVLERNTPLAEDEVASRVIGRRGGWLVLPEAGLLVRVPRGALDRRTRITVTAPAGNLVGYHFEPHGLEFNRPLRLTQDMNKTDAGLLSGLSVAYFEGELEPEVTALETLTLRILGLLGRFKVEHFSGYVIATN